MHLWHGYRRPTLSLSNITHVMQLQGEKSYHSGTNYLVQVHKSIGNKPVESLISSFLFRNIIRNSYLHLFSLHLCQVLPNWRLMNERGKRWSIWYLEHKWGCRQSTIEIGTCKFRHPFNRSELPVSHWVKKRKHINVLLRLGGFPQRIRHQTDRWIVTAPLLNTTDFGVLPG